MLSEILNSFLSPKIFPRYFFEFGSQSECFIMHQFPLNIKCLLSRCENKIDKKTILFLMKTVHWTFEEFATV